MKIYEQKKKKVFYFFITVYFILELHALFSETDPEYTAAVKKVLLKRSKWLFI